MRTPRKFNSNSSSKSMSKFIYYRKLLNRFNSRQSQRFATSIRNGAARFSGSLNWSELKMWDERTLRRCTKKLKSMHAGDLRRFPSLGSPSVVEIHLYNSGSGSCISCKSCPIKAKSCLGKFELRNSGKKSLRRSLRFSAAITGAEKVVRTISDAGKRQGYSGQELELNANSEDHRTILVGKHLEENSFRRSPRLSSTKFDCKFSFSNGSLQKMLESHGKSCRRVMSRNNSNLHSDAKTCLVSQHNDSDKGTVSFKHCDVKFIGEKQLRKSPILNSSTRSHDREASAKGLDVKSLDGMKFRRSPRFLSSSGNQNLKIFQKEETSKEKSSKVSIKYSKSAVEQHLKVATASGYSSPSITERKRSRCSAETIGSPSGIENDKIARDSFVLQSQWRNHLEKILRPLFLH